MIARCRIIILKQSSNALKISSPCSNVLPIYYLIAIAFLFLTAYNRIVDADDGGGGSLDLSSLASIASNLGSNPQIMNIVSSLLQKSPPATSSSSVAPISPSSPSASIPGSLTQSSDLVSSNKQDLPDTGSVSDEGAVTGEPLKRAPRPASQSAPSSPVAPATSSSSEPSKTAGPLSGLMSLLPSVLPSLNLPNLNLSSLTSLLGSSQQSNKSPPSSGSPPTATPTGLVSSSTGSGPTGSNPTAQSVINQVLTAYASGQIPNELIQLGLSGKVPPQIMELALSGQVPSPLIQMIITGQIPTSTITAFLNSMQTNPESKPASTSAQSLPSQTNASPSPTGSTSSGPISTTRSIFEALFSNSGKWAAQRKNEPPSIKVPTILGPMPIQLPTSAFSNVRRLGQLVGGTITNVASLIPY